MTFSYFDGAGLDKTAAFELHDGAAIATNPPKAQKSKWKQKERLSGSDKEEVCLVEFFVESLWVLILGPGKIR